MPLVMIHLHITSGYISPKNAIQGRFYIKYDVFQFWCFDNGDVSGKKNREFSHEDGSNNLLGCARRLYIEDREGPRDHVSIFM
ncbi:hypothetical protein OSB04_011303 [Centaurea solstitialis]|uniref:Uncharacterized protein n=1 Tax=Centaurea solstitialis TaxID=347529 RepID=A0AA38TAW7_9ASTR|nr:hypothetical protein OSB04_011303 [Centaurea solstitialis]